MPNTGKEFELLVASIEKIVHDLPGAKIQHNIKLLTKNGNKRQIDILITEERGRFVYKTIIECKDTQAKVDVNTIGAFKDLMISIGAHQGIVVSSSGYQSGALLSAKEANIYLYQYTQIQELEKHLKDNRFNIYKLNHVSRDVTINFKEKTPINKDVNLYTNLISSIINDQMTIVDIAQNFLTTNQGTIADTIIRTITNPFEIQTVKSETNITMQFPLSVLFCKDNYLTEITGFNAVIDTSFFTAPSDVKNISEYKDIVNKKTHALIFDVEFDGKTYKLIRKTNH